MKRNLYIILLSMLVLASACKKNQCPECDCNPEWIREHYAIGEDNGVLFYDCNSVRNIVVHYAYDMDHFKHAHIKDTILVEGYVGGWLHDSMFVLSDTAIAPGYYNITVDCGYLEVSKKLRDKDEACDGKLWIRAQFVLTQNHFGCGEPRLFVFDKTLGGLI